MNNEDFIKRLVIIQNYYQLNAAELADKIEVQRSSISHLLSGRNKPSLEFILKIHQKFKEIPLEWLIYGKNEFPVAKQTDLFPNELDFNNLQEVTKEIEEEKKISISTPIEAIEIEKIIVFYKNGTFKKYDAMD